MGRHDDDSDHGCERNVGGEVLKQAAAAGLRIRTAYQSRDRAGGAPAGVDTVLMDYTQPETVRAALRGVQRIFLVGPPVANVADLEGGVVRECRLAGVTHIVKLSARRAPGDLPELAPQFGGAHRGRRRSVHLSAAERILGRPATAFEQFARDYASAFRPDRGH